MEPLKLRPFGYYEDIAKYYNEADGDFTVDLSTVEEFHSPKIVLESRKKRFNMNAMYGSVKSSGLLPEHVGKYKKPNFSHKRVFGHKEKKDGDNKRKASN